MAFEVNDLRGFLFLVLFATPMIAATNIDCHGRGFHCVNSTHFMICVDLGIGISTTIDNFIIPCPPFTVCHKYNIFECEFPRFEFSALPPLQVIGVFEQSVTSEPTVVSSSATSPLIEVSSVTNKPISILSTPEEITPVPDIKVLNNFKEYTDTYNETSTKAEVTIQTTPSSLISEPVKRDDLLTKYGKSDASSGINTNIYFKPSAETSSLTIDPRVSDSVLSNSTSDSTPAESASTVSYVYRKLNTIINQTNDNNTLNQNDTGLNVIDEFTATEKTQVFNSDLKPLALVENTQAGTEKTFIISETNDSQTTVVTRRHGNVNTDSIITEKPTVAFQIDPDPIMINRTVNAETNITDKVESSTSTSINLGAGSTKEPSFKVEISQTVFNMTINDVYNETSTTTVSVNVSGAVENHFVVNNDLTKPILSDVVPNPITVKNTEEQAQIEKFPNDSNITEEVILHNDLQNNTKNNMLNENHGNINQSVLDVAKDNVNKLPEHVQDEINSTMTDTNRQNETEVTPKININNETNIIQISDPIIGATDGFNLTLVTTENTNPDVETKQSKPILLAANEHVSSDLLKTQVNNLTTVVNPIENVIDTNVKIITDMKKTITDFNHENNTQLILDLPENNKTKLENQQNETTIQQQAFAVPNEVANIKNNSIMVESINTTSTIENVSAVTSNSFNNDNIIDVSNLSKTVFQDQQSKTNNLSDDSNIIAILEPTVNSYSIENTTPMSTLKPTNPSEDLQLNGTLYQSNLNATLQLTITENTNITANSTSTTQNVAFENNTATEYPPEVSILQNVTNITPQINILIDDVLSTTVATTVFIADLPLNTTSITQNEVIPLYNDSTLNETTLAPLPTTVIESQTVPYETTTILPVPLDTAANVVTQSTLGSAGTTKVPFINILRETKPAVNKQTNYPNPSTEPSVDLSTSKTVVVEKETHVKEPIFENIATISHLEGETTSPLVTTVPAIVSKEYKTKKILDKTVDNTTQTPGLVTPLENLVEPTISVTNSSPITTALIPHEEVTSTTEPSQTKTTNPQKNGRPIDDAQKITDVEINSTNSVILQDAVKSTTTQEPRMYTTTVRSTTTDEISIIEKPILKVFEELSPVTLLQENKTLPSVTITTTPTFKENVTTILRDNKVDNLTTTEDSKNANNVESSHGNILQQGVAAPLKDVMKNNISQTTEITPIIERNEQLPLIKEVTEKSTFLSDNSPPALTILEITTEPQTANTQTTLTPTVELSDASFNYILPNMKSTDKPLTRSSNIDNTLPLNEVTTQQVLNSVTPPDSMVETIQVIGAQTSETSHLGLVVNKTGINNLAVETNVLKSTKHIDREYIENVTSVINVEPEATYNSNKLNDIDEKINTPNDGNIDVNKANNTHVNLDINNVTFIQTSTINASQDLQTPDKLKMSITLNNQEVNIGKHDTTQINGTGNELKLNDTKISVLKPIAPNKQLKASNKNNTTATARPFNCLNRTRGKYADKKDCRKFYTCVGNLQPVVGICPNNTVFSNINKQCTRNLSHCVRNNQFRCVLEGRFNDFLKDNIYYICVKNKQNKFLRYKFQCNSDYYLNKTSVKCVKNAQNSSQSVSSVSENSRVNDESLSAIDRTSKKTYNTEFHCEDEGSFSHSNDCSKYYECIKVKDVYRRRLKKCASDEVYDKERKQCVKSDSGEC